MRCLKKLVALITTISCMHVSIAVHADEEPRIAIIRRAGTPTPFEGVLMDPQAYAEMKARHEADLESAEMRRKLDLGLLDAQLTLRSSTTANALFACQDTSEQLIKNRDDRIESLQRSLEDAESDRTWSDIIAFGVGMGAVLLGALAISLIQERRAD